MASWKTALPFLLPSLAGFVVFSIIPMIMQIFVSLTSWDGLSELTLFSDFSGFMDRFYVGIENYKEILTSKEFYQVIGNTLEFVILYIPLMLIASMIVALILNSHVKGVGIFRVLYYIPVITSWVAGALIWKWVLSPEYGAINNILALFGIEGPSWLQSSKWAMPAIVLASVWKDMGYFGLMLMSGLQGINQEYYDAAAIDGAGKIKQFTRITLPLLTPTLFFVLIISLINSFQLFTQIMIMTPDGGPLGSTMVMVERIYKCGFRYYEMGTAAAYSWILFAILLLLTMVQMKLQNKWVNATPSSLTGLKQRRIIGKVAFYVLGLLVAIIVCIPFYWMIITSLKGRGAIMSIPVEWIPKEPTLDAYKKLFAMPEFVGSIFNSFYVSVLCTAVRLLCAAMAAFALTKIPFKGRNAVFGIYVTALMIPSQITFIPLFIIMTNMHLTNSLNAFMLLQLFNAFAIFMMRQKMMTINDAYIEAAVIDGASMWRIFFKIILPMSGSAMATLAILAFMDMWNDYLLPLVLLSERSKFTLPLLLSTLSGQYKNQYNLTMAGALISIIPILIVYIFAQKYFKEGLTVGGVKG